MELDSVLETVFNWSTLEPSEKVAVFRIVVISIGGLFGFAFLVWRAVSTDRLARAAAKQAQTAAGQLSVSLQQLENQSHQIEDGRAQVQVLMKNSELTAQALSETTKNNLLEHYYRSLESLSKAEEPLNRVVIVTVVSDITKDNPSLAFGALQALDFAARQWAPADPISAEAYDLPPKGIDSNLQDKLAYLKSLPLSYWKFVGRSIYNFNFYSSLQHFTKQDGLLTAEQELVINELWEQHIQMPVWKKLIFWYGLLQVQEVQAVLEAVCRIKIFNQSVLIPFSGINFDGCELPSKDISNAIIDRSTFRGSMCMKANFSGLRAVLCDFEGAMLNEANFKNASLSCCNFNNANLEGADFSGADIGGCTFINSVGIDSCRIENALSSDSAVFQVDDKS